MVSRVSDGVLSADVAAVAIGAVCIDVPYKGKRVMGWIDSSRYAHIQPGDAVEVCVKGEYAHIVGWTPGAFVPRRIPALEHAPWLPSCGQARAGT